MNNFVNGQRIFITGGSSGIGLCAARMLADRGFYVVTASRSGGEGYRAPGGGWMTPVACDVRDNASVKNAVEQAANMLGGIDILVHCAGFGLAGAAEDTPAEDAASQFDTNYFGVVRVNARVLPLMRAQGRGRVITVGSVAGAIPVPFQAHYSASKAALKQYAYALRMETASYNITCALIEPGDLSTGFTAARRFTLPENSPYTAQCQSSVAVMERDEKRGAPPEAAAKKIVGLCVKKSCPAHITVPFSYRFLTLVFNLLPRRAGLWMVGKNYKL